MTNIYSVDDLAKKCRVTARAVRLYMQKGLLKPQKAGKTYVFTEGGVESLQSIIRAKKLGFSLEDIRKRLDPNRKKSTLEKMEAQIQGIISAAEQELKTLQHEMNNRAHKKEK